MADVFVSYSRRDSEFVHRLADSIGDQGKEVWLDTEGIADAEVFPEAIKRAIEGSDAFVFVITPSAVESPYCENEVEYARDLQKRIVPVLRDPVPDPALPAEIRDRNWIPFTDDGEFDAGLARLLSVLDTDLEAVKAHTRWLVKALEWDSEGRDKSFLVRGSELKAAEAWLASRPEDADPAPTQLQRKYLLASREAAARRQRAIMGAAVAVAVVSIGLLIFALISRSQAVSERVSARAQALAAESQAQLPNDPEISLILGMRAVREKATAQTMFALRAALDASPLELALATVKPAYCSTFELGLTAAYSPDGRQIAEAVCNGSVRLLDAASGRLEHTTQVGHTASAVAYSRDGGSVAVASGLGATVVDAHNAAVVRHLSLGPGGPFGPGQVLAVAFSPDGRMLAASTPSGLTVWTVAGGRPRRFALGQPVGFSLAFSPDGRRLYTGGLDALVRVYDVATGRGLHQINPFPRNSGQSGGLVVAVSHDGRRLAVGYPGDAGAGTVSLYDTGTWRKQFDLLTIPDVAIASIAFSPQDARLAVGAYDGTAGVWSLVSREQLVAYDGPTASVNSASFSPDGTRVLTASSDGIVRVWRASGTERSSFPSAATADLMALHGNTLEMLQHSSGGGAWLSWLRLPEGAPFRKVTLLRHANDGLPSLSADGRFVFLARFAPHRKGVSPIAPIMILDAATGKVVRRLRSALVDPVGAPTFSADDSQLILEETPNPKVQPGPGGVGLGIAGTGQAVVTNVLTGRTLTLSGSNPCGPGTGAKWAFSADGRRVAQEAFCGIVDVWDTRTGRLLRQVDQGGQTSAVALDHDGSRVLVSSWDSRATIWSVATGRRLVNFVGHTRGIADAALSPDGTRVITGSLDRTLRVWDARTGQILRVLTFPGIPLPLVFSADASELALQSATPIFGVPNTVLVFATCPACQNPSALLALAAPHAAPASRLTALERTVINGS